MGYIYAKCLICQNYLAQMSSLGIFLATLSSLLSFLCSRLPWGEGSPSAQRTQQGRRGKKRLFSLCPVREGASRTSLSWYQNRRKLSPECRHLHLRGKFLFGELRGGKSGNGTRTSNQKTHEKQNKSVQQVNNNNITTARWSSPRCPSPPCPCPLAPASGQTSAGRRCSSTRSSSASGCSPT